MTMTRGRNYDSDQMDEAMEDDVSTPSTGNAPPSSGAASRRYTAAGSPPTKPKQKKKTTTPTKRKSVEPLDLVSDHEVEDESDLDNEASTKSPTKSPASKRSKEPADYMNIYIFNQ